MKLTGRVENRRQEQQLLRNLPYLQVGTSPPANFKAENDVDQGLMRLELELGLLAEEIDRETAKNGGVISSQLKLKLQQKVEEYSRGFTMVTNVSASWDSVSDNIVGNMKGI